MYPSTSPTWSRCPAFSAVRFAARMPCSSIMIVAAAQIFRSSIIDSSGLARPSGQPEGSGCRSRDLQQRGLAPAAGAQDRRLHRAHDSGEGDAGFHGSEAGGIGFESNSLATAQIVIEWIERHAHLHLRFLAAVAGVYLGLHDITARDL